MRRIYLYASWPEVQILLKAPVGRAPWQDGVRYEGDDGLMDRMINLADISQDAAMLRIGDCPRWSTLDLKPDEEDVCELPRAYPMRVDVMSPAVHALYSDVPLPDLSALHK